MFVEGSMRARVSPISPRSLTDGDRTATMGAVDPNGMAQTGPNEDLHRGAGTMIAVRWVAVPWVLLQILAYEIPYPPGYKAAAFGFLGALVVGNAALMLAHRASAGGTRAQVIGLLGLALDVAVLSAFVWLYAFDYQ